MSISRRFALFRERCTTTRGAGFFLVIGNLCTSAAVAGHVYGVGLMQGAAKDLPRKVHPHHDGVLEPEPKQHDAHQRYRGQRPAALGWGLGLRGSRGGVV